MKRKPSQSATYARASVTHHRTANWTTSRNWSKLSRLPLFVKHIYHETYFDAGQRSHGCRFSVVPHQSKFHDRCVFVYVSLFKRRVKVCFIIGLSKYIIFSLLDLLMYCLLHWLLIEKFLSSLCKVSFV